MKVRILALVAACVIVGGAANAQTAPFTENFDAGSLPAGWTVTVITGTGVVTWGVDASPATVAGGPSTFGGSPGSLNYNDGTDYVDEGDATMTPAAGSAESGLIDVSGLGGSIVVSFQCIYEVEFIEGGQFFDSRTMDVLDGGGGVLATFGFDEAAGTGSGGSISSNPPATDCPGIGLFHPHILDVSAAVGAVSPIRIRYTFNTDPFGGGPGSGFGIDTGFAGWFIDNLTVTCGDAIVPSTPVNLTPADTSVAVSPPGVTLTWTASTDTTPCGTGTIANYVVELDNDAAFPLPFVFSATPTANTVTTPILAPATYFWRVRAVDASGNVSPNSTVTSFIVEAAMAPSAPDSLFVNEPADSAQNGDGGFVDPVVSEDPVFSAIYRDPNTFDSATSFRWQVSEDPTFTIIDFDSGVVSLVPSLAKDARTFDLSGPTLQRNTVYFWRIQFTDNSSLTGPFSVPQSFRIGDDFEFGVRVGSSNHSRRCFVATAAHGSVTPEVASLQAFRFSTLEPAGAGRLFSRSYHGFGPSLAALVKGPKASAAARGALSPVEAAAAMPALTFGLAAVALLSLVVLGCRRM